jgi:hypothetical protein
MTMPTIYENEQKLNTITGVNQVHINQAKRIIYNLHIQPDIIQYGSLLKFEFTFLSGTMMDAGFYDFGIECSYTVDHDGFTYSKTEIVNTDAEFIKLFLSVSRK